MKFGIDTYRRVLMQQSRPMGEAIKHQSDLVMEYTWDRDLQSKIGYLYDYYSDDSVGTLRELKPMESITKVPVDIKFIVTQKGSLAKDQVEYQIQFKPSHTCPLPYFRSDYDLKYGVEYPIGLYIDIPDEQGVYRKWMICSRSLDLQFIKYSILPCNYTFRWVHEGQVHAMDGVARLRNSYNSGVWTDYLTTTVENQDQMWLPLNDVSTTIFYNQRLLISPPVPNPTAWRVTKVESLHPIGIYKVVVGQDLFDSHRDLVDLKRNWLIADYYKSESEPISSETPVEMARPDVSYIVEPISSVRQLKIGGGAKTFRFRIIGLDGKEVEPVSIPNFPMRLDWNFSIHGEDVGSSIEIVENAGFEISIRTDDLDLLATALTISASGQMDTGDDDGSAYVISAACEIEVVGL